MYMAGGLIQIGVAFWANMLWIAVMLLPAYLVVYYGVIAREERYLETNFGDTRIDGCPTHIAHFGLTVARKICVNVVIVWDHRDYSVPSPDPPPRQRQYPRQTAPG